MNNGASPAQSIGSRSNCPVSLTKTKGTQEKYAALAEINQQRPTALTKSSHGPLVLLKSL